MKQLQLAIAAIVDANAGTDHQRNLDRFQSADAAIEHARDLRRQYLATAAGKIGQWVRARCAHYRKQADNRRAFQQLLRLNDQQLKDIGLTRGDLLSVQLGASTLAELNAVRESRRQVRSLDTVSSLADGQPVGWREAPDEAVAATAKCA